MPSQKTLDWMRVSGVALTGALGLILYFAFKPAHGGGGLLPWDKADHFCAFFVLTVLAIIAFPKQSFLRLGIAISILGALIEIIQGLPFVNRDCDFWDWVAEMCALSAVYGVILAARLRRASSRDES
jgi:hypothetical protein